MNAKEDAARSCYKIIRSNQDAIDELVPERKKNRFKAKKESLECILSSAQAHEGVDVPFVDRTRYLQIP